MKAHERIRAAARALALLDTTPIRLGLLRDNRNDNSFCAKFGYMGLGRANSHFKDILKEAESFFREKAAAKLRADIQADHASALAELAWLLDKVQQAGREPEA